MAKDKKDTIKRYSVKKNYFMHYVKCTRVMLPVVFEELELFSVLFFFHYQGWI